MLPTKRTWGTINLLRLGEIKLGTKEKKEDGIYFTPANYFICPDEVKKVFGERPKKLRIMFPTEDSNQWVKHYYKLYSRFGNLLCRGDGETSLGLTEMIDQESRSNQDPGFRMVEESCDPTRCSCLLQGYCVPVMSLQFLLPDISDFGVYQLNTSLVLSMNNILDFLRRMQGTGQLISLVPLSLELREKNMPGLLNPLYVLHIVWSDSTIKKQRSTWLRPGMSLMLPLSGNEPPDDIFPEKPNSIGKIMRQDINIEETLLELWAKIKKRFNDIEIRDDQVASWFAKIHHLEVGLIDFEPPKPPSKFSVEILSDFLQSIDRHVVR